VSGAALRVQLVATGGATRLGVCTRPPALYPPWRELGVGIHSVSFFGAREDCVSKGSKKPGTRKFTRESSLVVPNDKERRELALRLSHDTPAAGHFGTKKTLARLQVRFWCGRASHDRQSADSCFLFLVT